MVLWYHEMMLSDITFDPSNFLYHRHESPYLLAQLNQFATTLQLSFKQATSCPRSSGKTTYESENLRRIFIKI